MQFPVPEVDWPRHLQEVGPEEDPAILLSGASKLAAKHYLVYAVRINLESMEVDFRSSVGEWIYADLRLDVMLEELMFFSDFDRTAAITVAGSHYILWMVPATETVAELPRT